MQSLSLRSVARAARRSVCTISRPTSPSLAQRVKCRMTKEAPHITITSIWEKDMPWPFWPFLMLSSIHTEPKKEIEVTKMIYDPVRREKVPTQLLRLALNDDYATRR